MIQKIDFAKYAILYTYGGIYMDMDVECFKSLNNTPGLNESDLIVTNMTFVFFHQLMLFLVHIYPDLDSYWIPHNHEFLSQIDIKGQLNLSAFWWNIVQGPKIL